MPFFIPLACAHTRKLHKTQPGTRLHLQAPKLERPGMDFRDVFDFGVNTSGQAGNMDISFSLDPHNTLVVRIGGDWNIARGLPSAEQLHKKIASTPHLEKIALDGCGLGDWDSSLLTFLINLKHLCSQRSIVLSCEGLPKGAVRLLDLASAVPE